MTGLSPDQIHVLHVDDDPAFGDVTATYLERQADVFDVQTVESPAAALERLDGGSVDCIVSDYEMPGTNGIEFLETVRDEFPDLPFILFTGKGSETVASEAISAGVTDYLQKESGSHQFELLANRISRAVEQYRTEKEFDRQNDLFEKAQDIADIGAWAHDLKADELRWTDHVYEMHGVSTDFEPTVDTVLELYHPEDREEIIDAIDAAVNRGEPYDIEARMIARDEQRWFRTLADPQTEDGEVVRVRGVVHEITEQKLREQQLRQYEYFFEYSPDLIILLDDDFTVQYQSPATALPEMDPIRIVGEDPLEYVHPEDKETVYEHFEELVENPKEPHASEFRIEAQSGEWRWVETRGINLLGEDPVDGILGMLRDVTRQKRQRLELERQNERLDEFASIVSHDLRNPLQTARLRVELAAQQQESEHLDAALDALAQSSNLIDDLLTLAREGGDTGDTESVDLRQIVTGAWQTVRTGPATLSVDTEASIRADPSRLQQLLQNLFTNAIEHGGPDVTVTVGDLPDGFYVADTGPGIPEEKRSEVFEAGYSTAPDGTGFGLRIVEQMAESHGWTVDVTDGPDCGAKFEITGVESD
jgi:PAS domain S-box-containing protein